MVCWYGRMLCLVCLKWYGLETELAYVVVVSPFWPFSSRFGYCYAWSLTVDLAEFILEFMGAVIACRAVWFSSGNTSRKFQLARLRRCGFLVGLLSRIKRSYMSASHPYLKVVLIEWRSLLSGYEVSGSWTLSFGGRKQQR